ncbi:hypothetical protein BWQ96_03608 [Gracilariopsis chorda]|uniref:Uncharacterized protein n=1 Tax=Gracilariopsis chorda TaxID=448386 RepID=A0A2V3IWZ1_9FLOR|nr:hypothetical protein BWQ96_03608 [Gracilariopsis chorda]|eukprot:PXF46619.1 hypothetical protein BWQ96_03608 [Gracilariopsis chorda]
MTNCDKAVRIIPALLSATAAIICVIALRKIKQRKESRSREHCREVNNITSQNDHGVQGVDPAQVPTPFTAPKATKALVTEQTEAASKTERRVAASSPRMQGIRGALYGIHGFFGAGKNNSSKKKKALLEAVRSCSPSSSAVENAGSSSSHAAKQDAAISTPHPVDEVLTLSNADSAAVFPEINTNTLSTTARNEDDNSSRESSPSPSADDGFRQKDSQSLVCREEDLINYKPKPNQTSFEDLIDPERGERSPALGPDMKRTGGVVPSGQHRSRRRRACRKRPRCRLIVHSSNEV